MNPTSSSPAVGSMEYDTANNLAPGTSSSYTKQANGSYGPPSNTSPTTNPTTPINSSNLTPSTPLSLPTVPDSTSAAHTNAIQSSQQAILGLTGSASGSAQTDYNNAKNSAVGMINTYLNKGPDQLAQENAAGVPQLQAAANSFNTQYLTAQATYNQQYNAINSDATMSTDQRARQITALQQQNGYALTNIGINAAIAQQNYSNAETIISHRIDLTYAPLKDAIDYGMQFLSQNKDILTQQEQNDFTAKLTVQQQTYDQGKFYDQLNATTNIQMIQDATANKAPADVINKMTQLIASGASAGEVAAAGGQYLANGNYTYQFNPSTQQFSLINSKTGIPADGTPPGSGVTYNANDPSSSKIVTAPNGTKYDFSSYATDPNYGLKINAATATIVSKVGEITSPELMQAAITTLAPNSKLDGTAAYNAAINAGMDPTVFAAQLQQESLCGTSPVAAANNNFSGITYTGSSSQVAAGITQGSPRPASEGGFYAKFNTQQDGLNYAAKVSAGDYQKPPTLTTPGQTTDVNSRIQQLATVKSQLPANVQAGFGVVNSTGTGYIDMSKVTDLPGFPSGTGASQAASYAKSLGLVPLTHDQAQAVQDYDTAMQKINILQDQWNAVAPGGVVGKAADVVTDPFSKMFDTQRGQNLIKYNSNAASAISIFNGITDSKRLSSFSSELSENALPVAPHSLSVLGQGGSGDTLADGNAKLDNLRANLNASLKSISSDFHMAPLSSDLPSTPLPKAGDVRQIGTGDTAIQLRYNADGSATVISTGTKQ